MNEINRSNRCVYCGSKDVYIKETEENKVSEICWECGKEIVYDRVRVGKKAKYYYISAVMYALKAARQPKVMITAAGKRRLTLLDALYMLDSKVEVIELAQLQTELGGLELRVILKKKEERNEQQ